MHTLPDAAPTGDAAPCLFSYEGPPRNGPAEGIVVELNDPTLPFAVYPTPHYEATTPLSHGSVSVEIERDGCGLATGVTKEDGSFSVEGTATGDVSIRLVPIDRPDLITTIHHFGGARADIQYPILTRAALDGFFQAVAPDMTLETDRAQILASFINPVTGGVGDGATIGAGALGATRYDGAAQTGSLGLAGVLNVKSKSYPGQVVSFSVHAPNGTDKTEYAAIAADAVSLILGSAPK
jgi:hypothetical protein